MVASLMEVGNDLAIVHLIPATLATTFKSRWSLAERVAAFVVVEKRCLVAQAQADDEALGNAVPGIRQPPYA